jgi:phosphatidylglycerophosphate synthase
MLATYILFFIPLLLFVLAFLYETFLSFTRLYHPNKGRAGYVKATWEFTHTLLVVAVVILLMMFSKYIDQISSAIFMSTFIAAVALGVRAVAYIQIFYVRKKQVIDWLDWGFFVSHVVAAVFFGDHRY